MRIYRNDKNNIDKQIRPNVLIDEWTLEKINYQFFSILWQILFLFFD